MVAALGAWSPPAAAEDATVIIRGQAYEPPSVTITAGDFVLWKHEDGVQSHTITADDGSFDSHPTCTLGLLWCMGSGEFYNPQFSEPGTYSYHCRVHPSMRGTVVVLAAPTTSSSTTTTVPRTTTTQTTTTTAPSVGSPTPTTRETTTTSGTTTTTTTTEPQTTTSAAAVPTTKPRDRGQGGAPLIAAPSPRETELTVNESGSNSLLVPAAVAGGLIVVTALGATLFRTRANTPLVVPVVSPSDRVRLRRRPR